ncbi:MAG: AEC family transporter, partial [Planctomycetota bacterium]
TAIGFLLAFGFARLVGPTIGLRDDASQRSFAICAGICNYGYIPLPLAQQFYPAAEVTLILHNVGVDIALWSVGLMIVSGGSPTESPATGRPTSDDDDSVESTSEESRPVKTPWWRALISPPMLAVVIALAIKATGITAWVPAPITSAATLMGACTIPMGLLLSGAIMIDCLKEADWSTGRGTILSALLLRLGLFPILMLGFGVIAISSLEMRQVMMLEAAMPAAIFPIILVRLYDKDTTTALHVVLSTSFIGIITIPMWLGIGSWWLGV